MNTEQTSENILRKYFFVNQFFCFNVCYLERQDLGLQEVETATGRVLYQKSVFKCFAKITGKRPCQVSF